MLIGRILKASNPDIEQALAAGEISAQEAAVSYNYTNLCYCWLSWFLGADSGIRLKAIDKRKATDWNYPISFNLAS